MCRPSRSMSVPAFLICCIPLSSSVYADPPQTGADHALQKARGLEIFKKQVKSILVERCVKCHGGKAVESGLDLTDRDHLLRGGENGPAILVGNSGDSLLCRLVRRSREPFMPKSGKKLAEEEIAAIAAWIDCGAPYDGPLTPKTVKEPSWTERMVPPEAKQFWSFRPLGNSAPPPTKDNAFVRTPVDSFILQRLEKAGLQPNHEAERRKLVRRAYFDLIGLPPTPDEVDAFLNDPSPDAYERLLDRLLSSPHYGERWSRHWLDLARFAESHGFEHDYDRPSAYHYRDFVIQALNDDLPYDTFVKWQLAGDEFAPGNRLALEATGFLAAGVHSTQITKREVEKQRYDELDDMAATIGTAMLGLTVGCARCHDHKFDPIPQRDYYRFVSTFTTTVRSEIDIDVDPKGYARAKTVFDAEHAPYVAAVRQYEFEKLPERAGALTRLWNENPERRHLTVADGLMQTGFRMTGLAQLVITTDREWLRLKIAAASHAASAPKPRLVKTLVATEGLPALRLHTQGDDFFKQTFFLRRGDPEQKESVAEQGFLQVLATEPPQRWQIAPPKDARTSYRRRSLANWLTDVQHGAGNLLARVIVNRLWQHHLGRGLVATPSDFGARGERPTHPELLDWLASELIRNGWHLKPIHKLIMASAVYREDSAFDDAKGKADHDNRLRWRWTPRRLEAETIRDSLLAISGQLDCRVLGPGTLDSASRRRSIYFTVKRSKLMPMMQVFDAPEALGGVAERATSTIAPQALFLMNNANVRGYARALAREIGPGKLSEERAIQTAYKMTVARSPDTGEVASGRAFLAQQAASYSNSGVGAPELALADLCQVLMCLNEFAYVE
jgi:mono/diheme cytochrome c family protein